MIKINGAVVEKGMFPNNEYWLKNHQEHKEDSTYFGMFFVDFKYENDADLIHLGIVKQHLDKIQSSPRRVLNHLRIIYMPYSRMDRENDEYMFSLKFIANYINSLNFDKVSIIEPHSDVTPALINRCVCENKSIEIAEQYLRISNTDLLYFPDAGAQKRYGKLNQKPQMVGYKKRDFKTGDILGIEILGAVDYTDKEILMVDDLCSAGGTFYYPAKIFKEGGAAKVVLVVAHCEDNIFNGKLLDTDYIDEIYTTNSILTKEHKKIKIEKVF